jgi:transcription elongation GreA/GreB family factor
MIVIGSTSASHDRSVRDDRRRVVAAVHSGSRRLDDIIARARAKSLELDRDLVFLTVTTRKAVSNELFTLRMRLARCPWPVNLEVTSIDREGLSRSQREASIADALVDEAERLGAAALVVGHDCLATAPSYGVAGRVAASLPTSIDVCFGQPGIDLPPEIDRALKPATCPSCSTDVHLTEDGRRLLTARASKLERHDIPKARARLRRSAGSADAAADYERLVNELRRLSDLVLHAPSTAELPDDPDRVELGEEVDLEIQGGGRRRILVVDPVEVSRGRACVSATSGLGKAVLGQRVGDCTAIPTAHGPRLARILSATR